jgi:hypothetical protein
MAETITVELDTRAFAASLRLTEQQVNAAMAKALRRTGFEIRDAEAARVGSIFKFAGPNTRAFLTRSSGSGQAFRFEHATPSKLEESIFPAPKTGRILRDHETGATIGADTAAGQGAVAKRTTRLAIEGMLATPVGAKRFASGRVGRRRSRSFIAGRAVLQRIGKGAASTVKVLFALTKSAKLDARLDFYRTARDVARVQFPRKAREELARVRGAR